LEYEFKPKRDAQSPVRIAVPEESQLLATESTSVSPIVNPTSDEPVGFITRIVSQKTAIIGKRPNPTVCTPSV
jgi:hypothetical protein